MVEKKAGGETMTTSEDKKSDKRIVCKIPIPFHITFFESRHSIEAQMVDHCMNGACFISDQDFFPGSLIIFKVAYCALNGSVSNDLEIVPSKSTGEVRWCRKLPAESSTTFGIGIKFYPQVFFISVLTSVERTRAFLSSHGCVEGYIQGGRTSSQK